MVYNVGANLFKVNELFNTDPLPVSDNHPPTIIVVHPKERRRKCTVEPLRGIAGFEFRNFKPGCPVKRLENYVRLAMDGPLLTRDDADRGLLVLDATWRHVAPMEEAYSHVEKRSLPIWKTAYPRISKMFDDPAGGLATIEALFLACHQVGRETEGLLDDYHWKEEFLRLNGMPTKL